MLLRPLCTKTPTLKRTPFVCVFPERRWTSSSIHPLIRDFASDVARRQPVFRISPSSVRLLTKPKEFHRALLDMIRNAEKRIFFSSLYIGANERELVSALDRRLTERPKLQLTLLLDLNRSTRPSPDSTAQLLLPLLRKFEHRVHVAMFRSPSLRGILSRIVPPRFNEGWGTWHAKIYGVDNDVMISGANLNKSYFSDRQDRYAVLSGLESVAQYCFDFMQAATSFSYKLLPTSSSLVSSRGRHSYVQEEYTLQWPMEETHPHYFNSIAEQNLSSFQKSYRETLSTKEELHDGQNILLVPVIQAGQFNIREEEWIFSRLFAHLARSHRACRPLLDLTSGYFSLYKPYQDLILNNAGVDCRIVAASPKANGFYGSNGISGRIPEGYTLFEQRFMAAVNRMGRGWRASSSNGRGHGVHLAEWEKLGWTYHAKGIWLSPSLSDLPILTLFGSTNLNTRSAHIDTELSFLMIIPSEQTTARDPLNSYPDNALLSLRQDLDNELKEIRSNAAEWKGASRKVRWLTKAIVGLLKGLL